MKKIKILIALVLLTIINSCSSEEVTLIEDAADRNTQINDRINVLKIKDNLFGLIVNNNNFPPPTYNYLGAGYNVTGEYANTSSAEFQVIDIDAFIIDYPTRVVIEYPSSQQYIEEYGENAKAYSEMVTTKVDLGFSIPVFGKTLESSFSNSTTNSYTFDGKYIYASYNLELKQRRFRFNSTPETLKNYLTPDFESDLELLSPAQIVEFYGTHVLADIYTGGALEIKFQSETTEENRTFASRVGLKSAVKDIFDIDIQNDVATSDSLSNYNRKLSYKTRGGDPAVALLNDDVNLEQQNTTVNFSNWQNSNTAENAVLVDFGYNGAKLIYEFVTDPIKKQQLQNYVDQYLIDNQVNLEYIEKPIHRYFNANSGDHFYTQNDGSYTGWGYEGVAFSAYTYRTPSSVPIYRYYNPGSGDHFYSKNSGAPYGYTSEGIEFYAYLNQANGTVPIYRYFNPNSGDHFYTKNVSNYSGYVSEGVAFYAF